MLLNRTSAVMLINRTSAVMFINRTGRVAKKWVVLQANDTAVRIITIYAPMIHTAPCVMLLMRTTYITWASGRRLGP
jgi:hypothetical protein